MKVYKVQVAPLRVAKVQVIQTRGKNKGSIQYLVVRAGCDGRITVPAGYRLIAIISEVN